MNGLNNWETSEVTSMNSIFAGTKLSSIDVGNWDTKNVKFLDWTFYYCKNLIEIKGIEKWDTRNIISMKEMFQDTKSLETIYYGPYFMHKKDADITQMFQSTKANKPTDSSWNGAFSYLIKNYSHQKKKKSE